jgi:hypothetical protein
MVYRTNQSIGANSVRSLAYNSIRAISDNLTDPRERMLLREKVDLIERNHALGNPANGFLLGGAYHTDLVGSQAKSAPKHQIHNTLKSEGMAYLASRTEIQNDAQRITQALSLLLGSCKSYQDVRDALPDMLRDTLTDTASLDRFKEPYWTLQNSALQLHQYHIAEPLMLQYYTHRILI